MYPPKSFREGMATVNKTFAWPRFLHFSVLCCWVIQMFLCNCLVCQRIFLSSSHQWGEVYRKKEKDKEEELLLFFTSLLHIYILDKIIFLPSTRCFPKHFYAWALNNIGKNCIDNILSYSFWKFVIKNR